MLNRYFIVSLIIAISSATAYPAQDSNFKHSSAPVREGFFTYIEGDVQIIHPEETEWKPADEQTQLETGSVIKTGPNSFARLKLGEKIEIDLNEESTFELNEKSPETSIKMIYGALRASIKDLSDEQLEIKTPVAVTAVRGTDFAVIYEEEGLSETEVYDGSIELAALPRQESSFSPVNVSENLFAVARKGQSPEVIGEITETRKLRWVHLKERMRSLQNIRKLRLLEASLQRTKGMLKKAKDEETRNQIREEISTITAERASLKKEINRSRERLDKISDRYSRIRKEKAQERRRLIEEKRQQIIQQRLERIEEKRDKRRKRLKEK